MKLKLILKLLLFSILLSNCNNESNYEYAKQKQESYTQNTNIPIDTPKEIPFKGSLMLTYYNEILGDKTEQSITANQESYNTSSISYVNKTTDIFEVAEITTIIGLINLETGIILNAFIDTEVEKKPIENPVIPIYFHPVKIKEFIFEKDEQVDNKSCKKYTKQELEGAKNLYYIWICEGYPLTGVYKVEINQENGYVKTFKGQ